VPASLALPVGPPHNGKHVAYVGGRTSGSVEGGTYTLLVEFTESAAIEVGAAGTYEFGRGWYAYTGSALGPGGFARVERHHEVARGDRDVRQWHVDYLLGHPATVIADTVTTPVDAECAIASAVADRCRPVSGIGASDCDCATHLAAAPTREHLVAAVEQAHDAARS